MNFKTFFIAIVILISLGMIVSSTELVFEQDQWVDIKKGTTKQYIKPKQFK